MPIQNQACVTKDSGAGAGTGTFRYVMFSTLLSLAPVGNDVGAADKKKYSDDEGLAVGAGVGTTVGALEKHLLNVVLVQNREGWQLECSLWQHALAFCEQVPPDDGSPDGMCGLATQQIYRPDPPISSKA